MMDSSRLNIFKAELDCIRERHALFFPTSQLKYINVPENNSKYTLVFKAGYDLSDVITLEIRGAFKFVFNER